MWTRAFGGTGCDRIQALIAADEIHAGGNYSSTIDLGDGPRMPIDSTDEILVSVGTDNALHTAHTFASPEDGVVYAASGTRSTGLFVGAVENGTLGAGCDMAAGKGVLRRVR
jgi:hypothetical protein